MDDLENVLDELAAQSHTTKMWVDNVIKSIFLMMRFCRASHEGDWPQQQLKLWWLTCLQQTSTTTAGMFSVEVTSFLYIQVIIE